jgi:hypothetical protein
VSACTGKGGWKTVDGRRGWACGWTGCGGCQERLGCWDTGILGYPYGSRTKRVVETAPCAVLNDGCGGHDGAGTVVGRRVMHAMWWMGSELLEQWPLGLVVGVSTVS